MLTKENEKIEPISDSTDILPAEAASVRLEGVFSKGYGHLPKMAMLDPDLTIEAKAIYALFCSYSGGGEDVDMPSTDSIRDKLNISKKAYLRHFRLLVSNDYIRVEQKRGSNGSNVSYWSKNVYTVVKYPAKFSRNRPDGQYKREYADIRSRENLIGAGYGLIPKLPLICPDIPIGVKGLYAYLITFSTRESPVVWPSYEMIERHLNLSEPTVKKYLAMLINTPYVRRLERERTNGQFGVRKYELLFTLQDQNGNSPEAKNDPPEPQVKNDPAEPQVKNDSAEPQAKKESAEPQVKNDSTEPQVKKATAEKASAEKATAENDPTYNTSNNNTSFNNTTQDTTINPSICGEKSDFRKTGRFEIDEMDRENHINGNSLDWLLVIAEYGNIPDTVFFHDSQRNAAINQLCEWEFRTKISFYSHYPPSEGDLRRKIFITFANAFKELLNPKGSGKPVSYAQVWENLPLIIDFGGNGATLGNIIEECTDIYLAAIGKKAVEYPLAYMKSIIWNAMLDGGLTSMSSYTYSL